MVTPDVYLHAILVREAVPSGLMSPGILVQFAMQPVIEEWANGNLVKATLSGSGAKGTANKSGTDVDLFLSLQNRTPDTNAEIFNKLDRFLTGKGFVTRRQSVSINIKVMGASVDLVPGRLWNAVGGDHSLYLRKSGSWTKTNIEKHISLISGSGRREEIRALKLWRDQWNLEFPSFLLELTVLDALGYGGLGYPYGTIASNITRIFWYLRDQIEKVTLLDPANHSNCVSDELTAAEKRAISSAANASLAAPYWSQIVQ